MNPVDIYRLTRNAHIRGQAIADTNPEALLVLDDHLRVEACSRSFHDVFRVGHDDVVGRPIQDLGEGQRDIAESTACRRHGWIVDGPAPTVAEAPGLMAAEPPSVAFGVIPPGRRPKRDGRVGQRPVQPAEARAAAVPDRVITRSK